MGSVRPPFHRVPVLFPCPSLHQWDVATSLHQWDFAHSKALVGIRWKLLLVLVEGVDDFSAPVYCWVVEILLYGDPSSCFVTFVFLVLSEWLFVLSSRPPRALLLVRWACLAPSLVP